MTKLITLALLTIFALSACSATVAPKDDRAYYRALQQSDKAHSELDKQ